MTRHILYAARRTIALRKTVRAKTVELLMKRKGDAGTMMRNRIGRGISADELRSLRLIPSRSDHYLLNSAGVLLNEPVDRRDSLQPTGVSVDPGGSESIDPWQPRINVHIHSVKAVSDFSLAQVAML